MSAGVVGRRSPSGIHWPSVFQFVFSGLALSTLWGLASISILDNFLTASFEQTDAFGANWFASFGYFFFGLLLLPSTILAFRRILGHRSREVNIPGGRFSLSLLLVPIVLVAGNWLLANNFSGWVAPLHIFVTLLSVGWLLWLAIHNLEPGSGQRSWGALGSGLTLTPLFAIFLEVIGALFLFLILAIYIGTNAELTQALERITSLAEPMNPNMELIVENLQPFFNDPFVLVLAIIGLGVFVPLIEELLKPLGVMLLLGRKLTPAQGFALGAICGAGYALAENLTVGLDGETWALISIGRFGTSAMHILTTALSGYALVRAKNEKRYLALFGIYLLNVAIHGIWNALVVLTSAAVLANSETGGFLPAEIILIAPVLLFTVALACIFFLHRYNHLLSDAFNSRFAMPLPKIESL